MFRYSGTELKARVMIEGQDFQKIKDYADEITSACKMQIKDYYIKYRAAEKCLDYLKVKFGS